MLCIYLSQLVDINRSQQKESKEWDVAVDGAPRIYANKYRYFRNLKLRSVQKTGIAAQLISSETACRFCVEHVILLGINLSKHNYIGASLNCRKESPTSSESEMQSQGTGSHAIDHSVVIAKLHLFQSIAAHC